MHVLANLTNGAEKMPLYLNKKALKHHIRLVHKYQKEGQTLNAYMVDFNLSERDFKKYVAKHKKLRYAIQDGLVFYKAFWERKLTKGIDSGRSNQTLMKLAVENALGWTELSQRTKTKEKPRKMYKVYVDLGPEEGNEDKIVPEKEGKKDGRKKTDSGST